MPDPARPKRAAAVLGALGLAAAAAALYAPVLGHAFINYDDPIYLTGNPRMALGLSREGIVWAFTTFFGANWFPLTWLSWLADQELHGLSPAGVHATNAALHAANTALLFLALRLASGSAWRSALVAAVFACHPLNVESVAWAAERKGLLAGFFWMLGLWIHAGSGRDAAGAGRLAALSLCLAAGLMAKPVLVTFPFVLLLLDFWPLGRMGEPAGGALFQAARVRRCALEKLPLLALVAVSAAVTFVAQRASGATAPLGMLSLDLRLANALSAYVGYVGHFLWPAGLAVHYTHPLQGLGLRSLGQALLLAAASALALAGLRRRPHLAVGWLWYLGTLVPMIGLVQVGSQAMADRYAYLTTLGLSIALVWSIPEALARRRPRLVGAGALLLLAALATAARVQLAHWRDSVRLFSHAASVSERNYVAHAQLADALRAEGHTRAAVSHYRAALEIHPRHLESLNNLAWILATARDPALRRPGEAVRLASAALDLSGGNANVTDTLAAAHAAAGHYARAVAELEQALARLDPTTDPALRAALESRLRLYRRGQPYRE